MKVRIVVILTMLLYAIVSTSHISVVQAAANDGGGRSGDGKSGPGKRGPGAGGG